MTYIPLEEIKKKIVGYLEESIKSQIFDFDKLSLISIEQNIKNDDIDIEKIRKAIKELIDDGEIQNYKSNLEIFVPITLKEHKNLISLKLGDPFKTIGYNYIYGVAGLLILTFIPGIQTFILSFDFSTLSKVIGFSVGLGAVFPLGFGYILSKIFNVIGKKLSSIGINREGLATIILFPFVFLLIYMALSSYFQKQIETYLIILVLGLGLTFAYYFNKMALKKSNEDIKLNSKDSD